MSSFANAHSINRQLAQILSLDKLPLGFFIGAGCPVAVKIKVVTEGDVEPVSAPLIPDVSGLTAVVLSELQASETHQGAINSVLDSLDEDGIVNKNIEVILGFVRALQSAAGKGEVRGLSAKVLKELDEAICKSIQSKVDKSLPDHVTPYLQLAKFIEPRRSNPVEIFTTNYDLLIEQALEEISVPYFDGFVGSRHPFFDLIAIEQDKIPPRWARLWKLHGSINWRQKKSNNKVCRIRDLEDGEELLIHPSHRKYDDSRRMPYLALIDRLRAFLRNDAQPVAMLIHGFSFSDEHLNAVLEEGMRANPQAACFAFQYADIDNYPGAIKLASRCHNFTVLARDCEISRGVRREWRVARSSGSSTLGEMFEWNAEELVGDVIEVPASFKLGDFATFGAYLGTFSGAHVERAGAGDE